MQANQRLFLSRFQYSQKCEGCDAHLNKTEVDAGDGSGRQSDARIPSASRQ